MKTKLKYNYDAICHGGFYTFDDGRCVETDDIDVFGMENHPFISDSDPDCCSIGSMLVRDNHLCSTIHDEWRDITEEELEEINNDPHFMQDLVYGLIAELTD